MDHFEHSMRAYLSAGEKVFQYPLMSYECETIEDACVASLHFLITHKFHIRKSKNCDRYFVAYYRSDTEYCDRQSPYNAAKTCKQDGPSRAYRDVMGTDEVKKVFHKIDSTRRMRVSRNPDDDDILDEYEAWREAMKIMRKNTQAAQLHLSSLSSGWKKIGPTMMIGSISRITDMLGENYGKRIYLYALWQRKRQN